MKRFIYTAAICMAAYFSNAQTVYVSATGKKFYHTKSCDAVKKDGKALELKEAKKERYEPCLGCKADKIPLKEEKATEVKKEEKK
jgi:hypothetical protein